MVNSQALLVLLESVLGQGKKTSKGNFAFFCPFCNHRHRKLEIRIETNERGENPYHCWTCSPQTPTKGKKIVPLLKKLKCSQEKIEEGKILTNYGTKLEYENKTIELELPKEFIPLHSLDEVENKHHQILAKHALKYLKSRNITQIEILKYNIGFCPEGSYANYIIIPSYNQDSQLNYFVARRFDEGTRDKYKGPPVAVKDIIGFELYINWTAPLILCEGIFDAVTVQRNVIPIFGKNIQDALKKKILKSEVNKIYIALDKDAIKEALFYCEELMSYGKEVYLVEIEDKDFSNMGREKSFELLENTYPLTYQDLIKKKLEII